MLRSLSSLTAVGLFLMLTQLFALAKADITTSQSIMAAYWGQDDRARQKDLVEYCKDDVLDIIMVSFLMNFGGNQLTMNLADNGTPCKAATDPNDMFICDYMTSQIKTCQAKGKVIMLSLGGDAGTYNLNTAADGKKLADTLWNRFGGGKSNDRPFGDAIIDGFDLDIEHGETVGYPAFIKQLRSHYATDKSKTYYISGAPQCQFPDHWLGQALDSSWFDFVFVQFYNNEECDLLHPSDFNFNQWDSWAQKTAPNKKVRVLLGLPADKSAAGSGYATSALIATETKKLKAKYKSFGGVMLWDVSHGYANKDGSPNFITAVAKSLHNGKGGDNSLPKPGNGTSEKPPTSSKSSPGHAKPTHKPTDKPTHKPTGKPTHKPTKTKTESASHEETTAPESDQTTTPTENDGSGSTPPATSTDGGQCTVSLKCDKNKLMQCDHGAWTLLTDCAAQKLVCDPTITNCNSKPSGTSPTSKQLWARLTGRYGMSPRSFPLSFGAI